MRVFGWIAPVQVTPVELLVKACWWLAAGMALSAAVCWLVLDLLALPQFTEHSAIIVLLVVLWFITLFALTMMFDRMKTLHAIGGLVLLSVIGGLLAASLFSLQLCLVLYGVTGGMFALGALIAHLYGKRLRNGRFYWLLAAAGGVLAVVINLAREGDTAQWCASLFLVVLFSVVSARKSPEMLDSARGLYRQQFVTVQHCATRGALSIWLGAANAFLDILQTLMFLVSSGSSSASR
ncbi:Bax inhibitor-1 family protein [Kosakonia cowanii]|uniref:Bax inhibitor-1 family protein n=1 Tax=Kosakonia cowanii TaxID=208223 RepID=UPI00320B6325